MALLFMDSFDHYATADLLAKWSSKVTNASTVTLTSANGRRSSGSLRTTLSFGDEFAGAFKTLTPTGTTAIVGVAASVPGTSGSNMCGLCSIRDGATAQITLGVTAGRNLQVRRGAANGTILGTSTATVPTSSFFYVELKVGIHGSAGTIDVRLDGVSVLSLAGQNTQNTGSASWSGISLGPVDAISTILSAGSSLDFDDLYVLDGSGASPWNTFLGDVRVDARVPTGAGAVTQWTPSTGSNWQNVDDATPDGDSTYNSTTATSQVDTFVTQDAAVPGAVIYGVQVNLNAKKSDAGACSIAAVVRQSGANQVGADLNPATSYTNLMQVWQTNPHTSAQWTEANFNADEFGYSRTA